MPDMFVAWLVSSPWALVALALQARYLGVILGPSATAADNYKAPLKKLYQRAKIWLALPLGQAHKFLLWNTMLLPLFSYVDQFWRQPPSITSTLFATLGRLLGGAVSIW